MNSRRLFLLLFLSFIFAGQLAAGPISRQEAMNNAQAFLAKRGKAFSVNSIRRLPSRNAESDNQPYYLFNVGNNEGYVIAAGDDRVPAILGYSDEGTLLPDSLPANMKAWLARYEQQIRFIQENDLQPNVLTATTHPTIAPMLSTTWDQEDPYNQSCPDFFDLGKCVTGCVATAMAQVMYYHRNNSVTKTTKTIPAYTCRTEWNSDSGTQQVEVEAVPAGSAIDWNNMRNSYSGSETAVQKKAVADLMFYCGASVSMNYANEYNGGSGAYSNDIPPALTNYFDYSSNTRLANRNDYTETNWDNLIYNELANNRPVLYTGVTDSGGGHAFVCDGYDGNGYYHINWGWGGYCDANFLLSNLLPDGQGTGGSNGAYNNSQVALIGAEPNGGSTPTPPVEDNISFADSNVKTICVNNWDTNGDGELSETEAAAVTSLGTVFKGNTNIRTFNELSYFTGLTSTGSSAFYGCTALTSVTLPVNLTIIGSTAFYNCYALTSLTIPSSVTSISVNAFAGCRSLSSIKVASGNTTYDSRNNCNAIIKTSTNTLIVGCKNTVIPSTVTALEGYAFRGCTGLTTITIPSGVSSIGNYTFYQCAALTSVTVENPTPVTIYTNTFSNRANATLFVPSGAKSAYEAADYWTEFKGIVEVGTAPGTITLSSTYFPDANFRAKISSITGVAEGGTLTDEILQSVTTINVSGSSSSVGTIASLKGIEFFTALTYLYCGYNQLTSLDVSKNTALTSLSCGYNQLTSLDVSKNTALTSLSCGGNQLTSLDVSKNTALTYLYCYNNQLTSLDVSKNTALTSLSCGGNQLTSLDVSTNTALTYLYCYNNQLTSLDVSKNTALTYLYCYNNQLTSLDVSKNTALTDLQCDHNQLTSLDVSKNTALKHLQCDHNQLTSLDVSKNTALTYLSCSYNQLTSLDVSKNTALTYLSCSYNQLTSLDVSKNTALTYLYCYNNQLTSLDVSKNTALKYLQCYNNQLTSLDVSKNTALTYLSCSYNQLTSLDVSNNTALTVLTCNYNQLMCLDASKCTKLESSYTSISSQSVSLTATKTGTNQYQFAVPEGFILSKVSEFKVGGTSVTPSLLNGMLTFTSATAPQKITYKYDSGNSVAGKMGVTVTISKIEDMSGVILNATNFPDDTFRAKISSITGVAEGGTLTEEILQSVTSINVSGSWDSVGSITSIKGIEYFTELTNLECGYNQLTSLDVSKNTALTFLSCGSNQLTSLDVSKNTALAYLYCDKNQLTNLDVSKNTALTYLDCSRMGLEYLDVTNNKALTSLYCSGNGLRNLNVSENTALTYLDCSYNRYMMILDVTKNTALTYLNCSVTDLRGLDVSKNTRLTDLMCDDNELNSLDVSKNTALSYLSCYGNNLTNLDVSKNTALTYLSCYGNNMTRLDVTKNTALTSLGCGSRLTSLDVSKNTALTYLSCSSDQLTSLDVSKNTALTYLSCDKSQLTSLDVSKNTALTYLSCGSNQLTSLDVSKNTVLTRMYCDNNQLTSLDVTKNTVLTELSCYNNQLMCLDASKCSKLISLFTNISSQYVSHIAYKTGTSQYQIAVPEGFNLSMASEFKVDGTTVNPSLSNGMLMFTSESTPQDITYKYDSGNSMAGMMDVTVTITEVVETDIANTVYMDDTEVLAGTDAVLSVKMRNEVPMEGFEFDLCLPEGVTVAVDEDGFPEVSLSTERTTARKTNSFDAVIQEDGSIRVLAASTNGSAISGNDGEIVTVKVSIADDMDEGDYSVLLKNIALSGTDATSYTNDMMVSTLTVNSYILGDANRDERVNVGDFTATAHHILGNTPTQFNSKAADANQDSRIDVGDLTAIAHIILYGSVNIPNHAPSPRHLAARMTAAENTDNYVYIDPFSASTGAEYVVAVNMKNEVEAEGFEFDMYLPDGMSFVLDEDGFPDASLSTERTTARKTNNFDAVIQPDGALRVLAASSNGSTISGNDGEVALVKVKIDEGLAAGTYTLLLKNIVISDVDAVSHYTEERDAYATVVQGVATGVDGFDADAPTAGYYYNLNGQLVRRNATTDGLPAGVYIVNGKKVVVK